MDRRVEAILSEWRELERAHATATERETREYLQGKLAELRDEHRRAVERLMTPNPRRSGPDPVSETPETA